MEGFYQEMVQLQEKLRKSEQQRFLLEEKFNEMMRITRDAEQERLRSLRHKYHKFIEQDRRRQERNTEIFRALERIETRAASLAAKTNRYKHLRQQYASHLKNKQKSTTEPKPINNLHPNDLNHLFNPTCRRNLFPENTKEESYDSKIAKSKINMLERYIKENNETERFLNNIADKITDKNIPKTNYDQILDRIIRNRTFQNERNSEYQPQDSFFDRGLQRFPHYQFEDDPANKQQQNEENIKEYLSRTERYLKENVDFRPTIKVDESRDETDNFFNGYQSYDIDRTTPRPKERRENLQKFPQGSKLETNPVPEVTPELSPKRSIDNFNQEEIKEIQRKENPEEGLAKPLEYKQYPQESYGKIGPVDSSTDNFQKPEDLKGNDQIEKALNENNKKFVEDKRSPATTLVSKESKEKVGKIDPMSNQNESIPVSGISEDQQGDTKDALGLVLKTNPQIASEVEEFQKEQNEKVSQNYQELGQRELKEVDSVDQSYQQKAEDIEKRIPKSQVLEGQTEFRDQQVILDENQFAENQDQGNSVLRKYQEQDFEQKKYVEEHFVPHGDYYVPEQENYDSQQDVAEPNNYIPEQENYISEQENYVPQTNFVQEQENKVPQQENYIPEQENYVSQENYAPQQEHYSPQQEKNDPEQNYYPQEQNYQQDQNFPQEEQSYMEDPQYQEEKYQQKEEYPQEQLYTEEQNHPQNQHYEQKEPYTQDQQYQGSENYTEGQEQEFQRQDYVQEQDYNETQEQISQEYNQDQQFSEEQQYQDQQYNPEQYVNQQYNQETYQDQQYNENQQFTDQQYNQDPQYQEGYDQQYQETQEYDPYQNYSQENIDQTQNIDPNQQYQYDQQYDENYPQNYQTHEQVGQQNVEYKENIPDAQQGILEDSSSTDNVGNIDQILGTKNDDNIMSTKPNQILGKFLESDTESSLKQDTKVSNESDFDFSQNN